MNGKGEFYLGILLFFCFTLCLLCEDMTLQQFKSIGQWLKLTDQNLMGCTVLSLGSEYVYLLFICMYNAMYIYLHFFISHYCFGIQILILFQVSKCPRVLIPRYFQINAILLS